MRSSRSSRITVILTLGLCMSLLLGACGTPSTGNQGTPQASAQPTTAQPTPKPKPTGVPTFTVKLCSQLMSVDEANSMIQPKTPATTIVPTNGDNGGACNYEASKTNIPLIIYFFDWTGPTPPIPQSDIDAVLSQAAGTDITIGKAVPVTGVGDQAEYVEATASVRGFTANAHVFYVIYGRVFFDCITYSPVSGGTMATQDQLQQCAQQVVSRF